MTKAESRKQLKQKKDSTMLERKSKAIESISDEDEDMTEQPKQKKDSTTMPKRKSKAIESISDEDKDLTESPKQKKDLIIVPLATKNQDGGRVYDKQQKCLVCGKILLEKIARHIRNRHKNELAEFMCKNPDLTEGESLERMKNKGSFLHNIGIWRKKEGILIVARRPSCPTSYTSYLPCPKCLAFFLAKELWRHKASCSATEETEKECNKLSRLMLFSSVNENYSQLKDKVIAEMKKRDEVFEVIKNDEIILAYGSYILENRGVSHKNYIAEKMRNLGRLQIQARRETNSKMSLSDLLCGKHFESLKKAAQNLCGFEESEEGLTAKIPSLALKVGHALKRCALLKQGLGISQSNDQWEKDGSAFNKLYELHWSNSVSTTALKTLGDSKFTKETTLPVTEDLQKMKLFCTEQIELLSSRLDAESCLEDWRALAEVVCSRALIFNYKRCNEIAKLTIKQFKERPNFMAGESTDIRKSMTAVEQKLCERYDDGL